MTLRTIAILMLFASLSLIGNTQNASAAEEHPKPNHPSGPNDEGLNLTDEQKSTIGKIQEEMRQKAEKISASLEGDMKAYLEQIHKDKRDEKKIANLIEKIATSTAAATRLRLEARQAFTGVMTSEQRKMMRERMEKQGDQQHGPRPNRGRPGQPNQPSQPNRPGANKGMSAPPKN
jgi:Spy/CpxP family protein refolding chaperone